LSVELHSTLAVEVRGAPHACLIARKREHRQWHWDRQVNADLTSFDFGLELAGCVTVFCKDRAAVAPLVRVNEVDCLLKCVDSHNIHYGSEDLLFVTSHSLGAIVYDGGTNPVAVWISLDLDTTTI